MIQQINLFQPQFRPQTRLFPAWFMLQATGALLIAMFFMYGFAQQRIAGIEQELEIVTRQESAAVDRLQNIGPLIKSVTGEKNWSEQLDDSLRMLAERQAVLNLIQGTTFGDTQGFSRHLRALARQDVEGVWLTRLVLSAQGDKTRLEGRAIRADLIPVYVQDLTLETPFAEQRFHRFRIDNSEEDDETALHFSMNSDVLLAAETAINQ